MSKTPENSIVSQAHLSLHNNTHFSARLFTNMRVASNAHEFKSASTYQNHSSRFNQPQQQQQLTPTSGRTGVTATTTTTTTTNAALSDPIAFRLKKLVLGDLHFGAAAAANPYYSYMKNQNSTVTDYDTPESSMYMQQQQGQQQQQQHTKSSSFQYPSGTMPLTRIIDDEPQPQQQQQQQQTSQQQQQQQAAAAGETHDSQGRSLVRHLTLNLNVGSIVDRAVSTTPVWKYTSIRRMRSASGTQQPLQQQQQQLTQGTTASQQAAPLVHSPHQNGGSVRIKTRQQQQQLLQSSTNLNGNNNNNNNNNNNETASSSYTRTATSFTMHSQAPTLASGVIEISQAALDAAAAAATTNNTIANGGGGGTKSQIGAKNEKNTKNSKHPQQQRRRRSARLKSATADILSSTTSLLNNNNNNNMSSSSQQLHMFTAGHMIDQLESQQQANKASMYSIAQLNILKNKFLNKHHQRQFHNQQQLLYQQQQLKLHQQRHQLHAHKYKLVRDASASTHASAPGSATTAAAAAAAAKNATSSNVNQLMSRSVYDTLQRLNIANKRLDFSIDMKKRYNFLRNSLRVKQLTSSTLLS